MSSSTRRWVFRATLAASLVLNLTLGWLLLSPGLPVGGGLRSAAPLPALQRLSAQLPAEDRAVLREAMLGHALTLRAAQARYEEQTARVLQLLAAETLDVPALGEAIAAARQSRQAATDELVAGILEALPRMSPQTRRKLAEMGRAIPQPEVPLKK